MKSRVRLVIVCGSLLSAGCLMAARTAYRSLHPASPHPLVAVLDANHDGVIDANELSNATAELKTLDLDHDGQLTSAEYSPKP